MSLSADLRSLSPEAKTRVLEAVRTRKMMANLGMPLHTDLLDTIEVTMQRRGIQRYDRTRRNGRVRTIKIKDNQ